MPHPGKGKLRSWCTLQGYHRCHIQGKNNPVANALSQATIDAIHEGIDFAAMPDSQWNDSGYKLTAQPSPVSNLKMFVYDQIVLRSSVIFLQANLGLWFLLTGDTRFLIWFMAYPIPLCMPHRSKWLPSLSGTVSTNRLVSGLKPVSLPNLWVPTAHQGSTRDIPGSTSLFQPRQWVEPLSTSSWYIHLTPMVYCFTRWPEAILLSDNSCARALVTHWITHLVFLRNVVWQGVTVHITYLDIHFTVVGHQAPSHHNLPPQVQ